MTLAVAVLALALQLPLPPLLPPLPPVPPVPCIPALDPGCNSDPVVPPPGDDPPKSVRAIKVEKGGGWLHLAWKPATDDVEVWGYRFYRDGFLVARRGDQATAIRLKLPCGRHRFRVEAVDSVGQTASRSLRVQRTCRP